MRKVAVGSTNPVKIEAVRRAFETIWPGESWEVVGVEVESGVSDQPMRDIESVQGARNRARRALRALDADWGVGLEGGLQEVAGKWFDCGWIVVIDQEGREGIGSTARIETPPKMMALIRQGMELGEVNDVVFGGHNTKQAEGHFGLMTNNAITRTAGYRDGVIMALARFIHPHLFEEAVKMS
jgi:inosine/xanthosine triphosphatase